MTSHSALRARAEEQAARFPSLLARAEQLAGTVLLGEHGRRRAGQGDDFWQYRPVRAGDSYRMIDWRRSARSDAQFVREREWQVAQSVIMWVDQSASMRFYSSKDLPHKQDRARVLALALAILLIRGGERVGLSGTRLPPRRGDGQILRLTEMLLEDTEHDFGVPEMRAMLPQSRAVFISDFLGEIGPVEAALARAADRGVTGAVFQVLDPAEISFPFRGRAIFQSIGGSVEHETRKADDLKSRYLDKLEERQAHLRSLCRATGWQFGTHTTDHSTQSALLWLFQSMELRS